MRAMDAIQFQDKVIDEVLRKTYDPEIPVNIYELGLIYEVKVDPETDEVHVKMTLTSPGCPAARTLPGEVEDKIRRLGQGVIKDVKIEITWEPPWDPSRMSEAARLQLGMF
jgi:FeS assembly SUF system protein